MRAFGLILTSICLSSSATARPPEADALKSLGITIVQPMSAEQLAATKLAVAAEIARADARSVFVDASDANGGRARHVSSGLVCPLGKRGQRILTATADAASCESSEGDKLFRSSVERAPPGATLEWAAHYAQAVVSKEPGYKASGGLIITGKPREGSDAVEHRTLQFLSKASGRVRNIRQQIGLVRGWLLTERQESSKNAQPNMMADMLSEATFGLAMKAQ